MKKTHSQPQKSAYGLPWIFAQTKGTRCWLLLLAVAGIAAAAVNMLMTFVLQRFVDIATGDSSMTLLRNAVNTVLVMAADRLVTLTLSVTYRNATNRTAKKLRLDMMERFYHGGLLEVQRHTTGESMTNLTADMEKVSSCVPSVIHRTVGNALSAVLAVVYLFVISWKLALILLVCIPLVIFCVVAFSPILQKASQTDAANEEKVRVYLQDVLEKLPIFKTCAMG